MEIELGGKARTIEVERIGERLNCVIDGRALHTSAVEFAPGVYSILIGGASVEARVEPSATGLRVIVAGHEFTATIRDPRQWRRDQGAAAQAEGRQQVLAPMPGIIVRVLVKAGETVQAGQGIVVVEAMKMQNELRAPKSGLVERLLVTENQAVGTGELLAVIA